MKLLSINNPNSGCDYHRIKLPITYLHGEGYVQGVKPGHIVDILKEADIVMYNRIPHGISQADLLRYRKAYGFRIVVDIDDYWHLYGAHHAYREWKAGKYADQIVANMRDADAVLCTGQRLRERIRPINPNVFVVPNALPFGEMQFTPDRMPPADGKVRFIYVGGGSHLPDVELLRGAMSQLAHDGFGNEVTLGGINPDVHIYQDMIKIMSAGGKLPRFKWLYPRSLDNYMDLYSAGDVALAPLQPIMFNRHKSNLKIVEAASKAMPIIASNTGPYMDDLNPLILRASTAGEWIRWFRYCAANPSFVEDNGAAMLDWGQNYYELRRVNVLRMDAFENVMKYGKRQGNTTIHSPGL